MKIGLALSGGAALGIAHLGVLKYLEEKQVSLSYLAGTSVGSIVASLFCAGISLNDMEKIVLSFTWKEVAKPALPRWGLIDSLYLERIVEFHIGTVLFEDLKVPLLVNALNLTSGEEVVFDKGPVAAAVRASCAIPGIFTPIRDGGKLLVDGGVINNLPAKLLKEKQLDKVIAVDLSARNPLLGKPHNIFEVLLQSFLIIQRTQRQGCHQYADLLIEPELSGFTPWDVTKAEQLIQRGYEACREALASDI